MANKGFVVWRGKSPYNGAELAAVVTTGTANAKTGPIDQLWIIQTDTIPTVLRREGRDGGTCGTCPLKSGQGCYVNVCFAPSHVWRKYQRGGYADCTAGDQAHNVQELASIARGRGIRLGAYGDPAMLPISVIEWLCGIYEFHTGYTHQWRNSWCNPDMKKFVMASCDTYELMIMARRLGWSTFRHTAKIDDSNRDSGELRCFSELNLTCSQCRLCNGASNAAIVIERHGPTKKRIKHG